MTYIVAELSGSHNGKLSTLLDLVATAKWAGADAVKLQTYKANIRRTEKAMGDGKPKISKSERSNMQYKRLGLFRGKAA